MEGVGWILYGVLVLGFERDVFWIRRWFGLGESFFISDVGGISLGVCYF